MTKQVSFKVKSGKIHITDPAFEDFQIVFSSLDSHGEDWVAGIETDEQGITRFYAHNKQANLNNTKLEGTIPIASGYISVMDAEYYPMDEKSRANWKNFILNKKTNKKADLFTYQDEYEKNNDSTALHRGAIARGGIKPGLYLIYIKRNINLDIIAIDINTVDIQEEKTTNIEIGEKQKWVPLKKKRLISPKRRK